MKVSIRPEKSRPDAVETVGYACSKCEALYRSREKAFACCRCKTCGTKTEGCDVPFQECAHCVHVWTVKSRRAIVKREKKGLAEAERDLRRVLGVKRPSKGTPA